MNKKISIFIFILAVAGIFGIGAYAFRFKIYEWQKKQTAVNIPAPIDATKAQFLSLGTTPRTGSLPAPPPNAIMPPQPQTINLAVPFTPQAPYAVWDAFHNDACEEASVLMVARFWLNQPTNNPAEVESELLKIKAFEDKVFGYSQDTSLATTARILKEYFGFKLVDVQYDITLKDITDQVLSGRPVIVPASGRELKNPFFKQPGPLYHMLVIKGVTSDGQFITNDPGTKRGADIIYGQETLFNAINDWDDTNHRLSGRKAIMMVYP